MNGYSCYILLYTGIICINYMFNTLNEEHGIYQIGKIFLVTYAS